MLHSLRRCGTAVVPPERIFGVDCLHAASLVGALRKGCPEPMTTFSLRCSTRRRLRGLGENLRVARSTRCRARSVQLPRPVHLRRRGQLLEVQLFAAGSASAPLPPMLLPQSYENL